MKKILTDNIGLKISSVAAAIILWIVVINVDDPMITRVYTGIPVEITNISAVTEEGKTYEIAEGSETISVSVTAGRSIIESLSKENIKATADLKNLSFMNTVPIEIRSNRYADKISSMTSRTSNISVLIENRKDRQLKLSVATSGSVAAGYIAGNIIPDVDVVKITGPESKVNVVNKAEISVDFSDMNESFTTSSPITLYDAEGGVITDPSIEVSKSEIRTSVEILESKEIPVTASCTGIAAPGFSATGIVVCDPSGIVVAGKGSVYEKLSSIAIPDSVVNVDGASESMAVSVNINDYLPAGVVLADESFDGIINVVAVVEPHDMYVINLPVSNIRVTNLPEGYTAHIVSGEDTIPVEISGLPESLSLVSAENMTAVIDCQTLSPRLAEDEELDEDAPVYAGSNDGKVILNLPEGITQNTQLTLEVVINHSESEDTEEE